MKIGRSRTKRRKVKYNHIENIAEDNSGTGIFGDLASEGSNTSGNKSEIGCDRIFYSLCRICFGILPGDAKMDTSLYLLRCRCRSNWKSFLGSGIGGNDRCLEREDKSDIRFNLPCDYMLKFGGHRAFY